MSEPEITCPFHVGDLVRFTPSERTRGLYQDVEALGIKLGDELRVAEVRGGCYLYFAGGIGGWPWSEFTPAS